MRNAIAFLSGFTLMVIVGCASIGLETPKTFNERIAYTTEGVRAVVQTTTKALTVGTIKRDEAISIREIATEAANLLDAANIAYNAGDVQTAEGRLAMVQSILTALQARVKP